MLDLAKRLEFVPGSLTAQVWPEPPAQLVDINGRSLGHRIGGFVVSPLIGNLKTVNRGQLTGLVFYFYTLMHERIRAGQPRRQRSG